MRGCGGTAPTAYVAADSPAAVRTLRERRDERSASHRALSGEAPPNSGRREGADTCHGLSGHAASTGPVRASCHHRGGAWPPLAASCAEGLIVFSVRPCILPISASRTSFTALRGRSIGLNPRNLLSTGPQSRREMADDSSLAAGAHTRVLTPHRCCLITLRPSKRGLTTSTV
jgi:hypothetical protein